MSRTRQQIYADVPEVNCRGLCSLACGPIAYSEGERAAIVAAHGSAPEHLPNLRCDKLIAGRCAIYADRPLLCRLFAAVKGMRCPHGCTPKRLLSDREAHRLLDEIETA